MEKMAMIKQLVIKRIRIIFNLLILIIFSIFFITCGELVSKPIPLDVANILPRNISLSFLKSNVKSGKNIGTPYKVSQSLGVLATRIGAGPSLVRDDGVIIQNKLVPFEQLGVSLSVMQDSSGRNEDIYLFVRKLPEGFGYDYFHITEPYSEENLTELKKIATALISLGAKVQE